MRKIEREIFPFPSPSTSSPLDGHEPPRHSHIRPTHLPCGVNEPVHFPLDTCQSVFAPQPPASSLCLNLCAQPHLVCSFRICCFVCHFHNHQVSLRKRTLCEQISIFNLFGGKKKRSARFQLARFGHQIYFFPFFVVLMH